MGGGNGGNDCVEPVWCQDEFKDGSCAGAEYYCSCACNSTGGCDEKNDLEKDCPLYINHFKDQYNQDFCNISDFYETCPCSCKKEEEEDEIEIAYCNDEWEDWCPMYVSYCMYYAKWCPKTCGAC